MGFQNTRSLRTIIAGSRKVNDASIIDTATKDLPWEIGVVLSGAAVGVDELAIGWAGLNHIPIEVYPADWEKNGKSAGYIRNAEMLRKAEALIAIWDGSSRGTKNMIDISRKSKIPVRVYDLSLEEICDILPG